MGKALVSVLGVEQVMACGRPTSAAPDRPIGREIGGTLVIGGVVGDESSAHKPGGR